MNLSFEGNLDGLEAGLEIMGRELGFNAAAEGIPVTVCYTEGPTLKASYDGSRGEIVYGRRSLFFRALGLFAENLSSGEPFDITETSSFETNGVMVDVSRNAILRPDGVKRLLRIMAVMGLNMLMLYTEDTYTIDKRPYFGYMRGRYTYAELKECDDYADTFGIEMVPCIQTLAHLAQALKWDEFSDVRDTADILLAGSEKTYALVGQMIASASAPFRSRRIHIGMDEAHNLGLGRYLDLNGFRRRFDIMNSHLSRVMDITSKYGLKPMIWSDMYFRLGSKTGDYYDLEAKIPENAIKSIPEGIQLVYWDYYHNDEDFYRDFIKRHRELAPAPVFAGGVWTWSGNCVNYGKTFATTNAALAACKKEGVKEVFATLWFDNGAETNVFSALPGLQLFAEHGYCDVPSAERLARRFEFCTGGSYEDFMNLSKADLVPGAEGENIAARPANPSEFLLWQDLLAGLFDRHTEGFDMACHYAQVEEALFKSVEAGGEWQFLFETPQKLCSVLKLKSGMGTRIRNAYVNRDLAGLREIAEKALPELYVRTEDLRKAHRAQWFAVNKPFGWEVLDLRYGGLLARIESADQRLRDYLEKKIDAIEELEEERLYFDGPVRPAEAVLGRCNQYHRIASAGSL